MALKASPDEQALLLDIQSIDTKLQQLDHRAKSLPEHAVLQQLAVENSELLVTLAEQKGVLEDARIELKRVESDVEVVEARISRDSARLQASSSVKDVAALEQELAALGKRQFDLEEIELTVMERVEEQDAVVGHLGEQVGSVQGRMADVEGERDAAVKTIDAERANASANRSALVSKVSPELLALYEKQRERYGSGASLLRGGVSLASGVKLNESDMVTVRAAAPDDVLLCPDSNAILVRTGESGL
jgi:predicted  nucleic acid-binding Zn-ribbon protein